MSLRPRRPAGAARHQSPRRAGDDAESVHRPQTRRHHHRRNPRRQPTGQYDSTKLVNIGNNRWGFKPEVGISRDFGRWTLEGAAGVWLFTDNKNFYGGKTRSQDPISSLRAHAVYTFKPRMWLAFDCNFYSGGRTSVDGVPKADSRKNSRAGLTLALPVTATQSPKVSYSQGAFTNIGADFHSIGVAWQVIWRDKR